MLLIRPIWGLPQRKLFSAYQDNGTTKYLLMYFIWLWGFHRYFIGDNAAWQAFVIVLFCIRSSSLEIHISIHFQDDFPQVRKLFLCKVHQYIKERALDAKYACAFLFGVNDYHAPQYEEVHILNTTMNWFLLFFWQDNLSSLTEFLLFPCISQFKHNLIEVVQICQQVKMRQLSVQADMNLLTAYPEYIISFLVHGLAHDPSSPDIEDHENVKAFGPIYWYLI